MKKIFAITLLLAAICSCSKNLTVPTLHSPAAVTGFAVSSNNVTLSPANDSTTVVVFAWPASTYGVTVPVTYPLQIDQPSDTSGANAWGNALNTTIATDSLTKS